MVPPAPSPPIPRRRALAALLWTAVLALGCSVGQPCPTASLDAALERHVGQRVSLRDVTDFSWSEARRFRAGAPAERVRKAADVEYRPYADKVPEGLGVIAFTRRDAPGCLATWTDFRIAILPYERSWNPAAPSFEVASRPRGSYQSPRRGKRAAVLDASPCVRHRLGRDDLRWLQEDILGADISGDCE